MRSFLKKILLFSAPILVVFVAILFIPIDKRFAYNFIEGECAGHGKWVHGRLYENPTPIDVALVGTSVGWGLFDDESLSEMLSEKKGKPINVVNLSFCRPGFNMRALMIEEIIKTKQPKRIVLELRWRPSRGGHHLFGFLASTKMLLNPATRLYQPYYADYKKALIVRWEKIRQSLYTTPDYVPDKRSYGGSPDDVLVDQNEMKRVFEKVRNSDPLAEKETLQETIHFYVYWKNMEYIAQLCKDAGIELSFFYVNRFGNPITYPKYRDKIEQFAPIWYAPDSIFHKPEYYADVVHFNRQGTNAITPILYEYLEKYDY